MYVQNKNKQLYLHFTFHYFTIYIFHVLCPFCNLYLYAYLQFDYLTFS